MVADKAKVRHRCLIVGCNPLLISADDAEDHFEETGGKLNGGHRTAKWPVRSKSGEAKATQRNRTGYYRKYNRSGRSYNTSGTHQYEGGYPFSVEALGQD